MKEVQLQITEIHLTKYNVETKKPVHTVRFHLYKVQKQAKLINGVGSKNTFTFERKLATCHFFFVYVHLVSLSFSRIAS